MRVDEDSAVALRPPALTPGARRILDAASELFYRRGIHAVGVEAIAAASGVTKRTLYDRFGSKDALVTAYLQARHERWWERMERRVAAAPAAPVLALFDAYTRDADASRGCGFLNAAAELPADHPALAVVRAHKRAVLERLTGLLATGPDDDPPGERAREVFLLLEGAIAHRGIDDHDRLLRAARGAVARVAGEPHDAPAEGRGA